MLDELFAFIAKPAVLPAITFIVGGVLRIQLGRVLEMAESSPDKCAYENKISERFGGQKELELVVPTPSGIPAPRNEGA